MKRQGSIMTNKELIEYLQKCPLDSEIILSIMPCSTKADELIRCGTYGAIKVENKLNFVIISNHI